jgi:hypothetical protein
MLSIRQRFADRSLWVLLSCSLILCASLFVPSGAQERRLRAFASVSDIEARIDRGPLMTPIVIYVTDQDGRRIPGALVVLTVPAFGASATFLGGQTILMLTTGADGSVTVPGFIPNKTLGEYQITVKASYQGLEGTTAVKVRNVRAPVASASKFSKWVAAATSVAAVTTVVLVGTGRIGKDPKPNPNPTVITISDRTVGPTP